MDNRKLFYNTVLSQTISNCGKYLFIGNIFGDIFVLSIKQLQNNNEIPIDNTKISLMDPIQIFNASEEYAPINSLAFHRDFLIVGTIGVVMGYIWDEDKSAKTKKAWEIKIPSVPEAIETTDVNFLWLDKDTDTLYAGCGDNMIYSINLEEGKIIRNFSGHKDYIHSLAGYEKKLFSASEDGSILFWDPLDIKSVGRIEPYRNEILARPEFGKWQGTVSVTNDWLVCGGGPKSSMWHLRSLECTNVLEFPEKIHCSGFLDDMILVAGEHSFLNQYSFNGKLISEIPVSGVSVYSIVWQTEPYKLMSIGGTSNSLDVCTTFNYRDMVVKLYKTNEK